MKTVTGDEDRADAALVSEIVGVLSEAGLVCLPCGGRYRIVADLTDAGAVMELMQSKHRVQRAPALVFVDSLAMLATVTDELDAAARVLAQAFWPGRLTIRAALRESLPAKVQKLLGGQKSRVGVRVPASALARAVVGKLGRPLLVSSANYESKGGDSSVAQVRKNFGTRVRLLVDQGDLTPEPSSTVVEIVDGRVVIDREGAIDASELEAALAGS
ncbi:MAG: Sua5/YciO/YrdC/YwlC family protein [Myxococcota bacterium]